MLTKLKKLDTLSLNLTHFAVNYIYYYRQTVIAILNTPEHGCPHKAISFRLWAQHESSNVFFPKETC